MFRHEDNKESALKIIDSILNQGQTTVLAIQHEMIDQGRSLDENSEGIELEGDLRKQREAFEKRLQ